MEASTFSDPAAGPSRYMQVADSDTKVGFISPMSNNFCSSCNRVRLTVEGLLLLCLGNEHSLDLRSLLREHPEDIEAIKAAILGSMVRKPERHYFDPNDITITRHMSATGG
jgi:cyclic pyranopterin phosphate synthase